MADPWTDAAAYVNPKMPDWQKERLGVRTFHCGHTGPITAQTEYGLCQDCIDAMPKLPDPYILPVVHGRNQVFRARPRR